MLVRTLLPLFISLALSVPAHAEFIISSAILEFNAAGPSQQDIEIISQSNKDSDYIVAEVSEIINPGTAGEERHLIDDPTNSWLFVTPDKTVVSAGSRKVVRFVRVK